MADAKQKRSQRLLVMLTDDELKVIDEWRFQQRMPSRAAAIRELVRRGLADSMNETGADTVDPEDLEFTQQSADVAILPEGPK